MSYQVLARKWRPRFFREMIGQEHVLQALINALDHGRLHHAYLFTGTRGVGKTTIARILAKCLNCEAGVSSEPCGTCSSCQEINDGCFVDLIEVDAASRTKVEDTRELLDNVQYAPTKGRYKVYLIDEVHMLSTHSFNALLKTLEEPPEHVKFLLATTDPQKLPATILSRCLQFHLKNMVPENIVQHLQHILQQEMVDFEELALWALARSAEGSMRDALSLTDQAIAFGSGKLVETDVRSMLGSIDQQTVYHLAQALAEHDADKILQVISEFSEQAPDYVSALDELLLLLHRMTVAQMVPGAVDNSLGDQERVVALAQSVTAEELQLFYQMGLMGKRDMSLAPDLRTGLEMAVLRMLAFRPEGLAEPPSKVLPDQGGTTSIGQSQSMPQQEAVESVKKSEGFAAEISVKKSSGPESSELGGSILEDSNEKQEADIAPVINFAHEKVEPEKTPEIEAYTEALAKSVLEEKQDPETGLESKQQQETVEDSTMAVGLFQSNEQWLIHFQQLPFNGLLKSVAAECVLVAVKGSTWQMQLDRQQAQLYNARHEQQIADVLSQYFATTIEISIEEHAHNLQTPAAWFEAKKQLAYEGALAELQADSGVQEIVEQYAAEIMLNTVQAINNIE